MRLKKKGKTFGLIDRWYSLGLIDRWDRPNRSLGEFPDLTFGTFVLLPHVWAELLQAPIHSMQFIQSEQVGDIMAFSRHCKMTMGLFTLVF